MANARLFPNGVDLNNQRGQNVGDPTSSTDMANKQYVDNVARNTAWREACVAASTANLSIAATPATLDGVTITSGMRILLKDQTTASQNGPWLAGANTGAALTRPTDYANGATVKAGLAVDILGGTANGDKVYHITAPDTDITVGTDATTWNALGGGTTYTGSNGVTISGSAVSGVAQSGGGLIVGASGFAIDTAIVTRKFAQSFGDGTATSYTFTHGWGTKDVQVQVFDNTGTATEDPDITRPTSNTVVVAYNSAPATSAKRCVIFG